MVGTSTVKMKSTTRNNFFFLLMWWCLVTNLFRKISRRLSTFQWSDLEIQGSVVYFLVLSLQVLYQQFKFFLNFYFLAMACSQFIPSIRVGYLYTYWLPLVSKLSSTVLKCSHSSWQMFAVTSHFSLKIMYFRKKKCFSYNLKFTTTITSTVEWPQTEVASQKEHILKLFIKLRWFVNRGAVKFGFYGIKVHLHWANAKAKFFLGLYHCSMWTLNWILYEPVWKRCRFHFHANTRACLHQASESMLWQWCDNANDTALIENNGITPDWVCNPFLNHFIVFSENSMASIIT